MKTLVILILLLARVCFGACNSAATMGWTPLSCAKTVNWYDPGILVTTGTTNKITVMQDITKSGRDCTQGTATANSQVRIVTGDNGWQVARFTNSAWLTNASKAWGINLHIFVEEKLFVANTDFLGSVGTGTQFSQTTLFATIYDGTTAQTSSAVNLTAAYLLLEGSVSNGICTFLTNAVSIGTGSVQIASFTVNTVGNANGTSMLNGDISAMVICSSAVQVTDVQMMRDYFGKRRFNHL